jgi:hypothetical protein
MYRKLLGLIAFVFAVAFATSAQAANVFNQQIPLTLTVSDSCTGEDVDITGNLHVVVRVTADNAGGFHLGVNINSNDVHGVGEDSGIKYTGQANANGTLNLTNGATEGTLVLRLALESQGNASNLTVSLNAHITINANGDVTAVFFDFSGVSCS